MGTSRFDAAESCRLFVVPFGFLLFVEEPGVDVLEEEERGEIVCHSSSVDRRDPFPFELPIPSGIGIRIAGSVWIVEENAGRAVIDVI